MADVKDVEHCEQGGTHTLQYQGAGAQMYTCIKCGDKVSKASLKTATDPVDQAEQARVDLAVARALAAREADHA